MQSAGNSQEHCMEVIPQVSPNKSKQWGSRGFPDMFNEQSPQHKTGEQIGESLAPPAVQCIVILFRSGV